VLTVAGRVVLLPWLFSAVVALFFGLTLLKFSNPPIMEKWVTPPTNAYEFVLGSPWPIAWGYGLLAAVALFGLTVARWKTTAPLWLVALPLAWLAWECVSAMWTINPALSRPTIIHFIACATCFYLGYLALAQNWQPASFFPSIIIAMLIVIAVGWEQHFGGLEQTRQYFYLYLYPRMKEVSPEYLQKLSSNRIFSTLFYPNALAGAFLLFLPAVLEFLWQARRRFTQGARTFLVASVAVASLACLYWSGSKGGWLLMLLLGLLRLLRLPLAQTTRRAIVISVLVVGLGAFFWRYSGFFHKGATSVSARFDYWQAALQTVKSHPFSGTGPGTFSAAYAQIKRPDAEMARLVHNDYLQQASDSGIPGFLLYIGFVVASLILAARSFRSSADENTAGPGSPKTSSSKTHSLRPRPDSSIATNNDSFNLSFAVWLGVLGWSLQSFLEFGLYIPALAWPAFAFLGLLLARPCSGFESP
jgi:O-antigen ligase